MRLRPKQQPYPPMWHMRNVETAAVDGMNTVIVGSLDSFERNVRRYHELWSQHHGAGARTLQGTAPKIGLVNHIVLAQTEAEALAIARPAWEQYVWNLETPRRSEAERRGLTQFFGSEMQRRPAGRPSREADPGRYRLAERTAAQQQRRANPGGIGGDGVRASTSWLGPQTRSARIWTST
jgi:alkanesulfonate monooxygenase SsuD/methylene tetrahydromethanopterin reductase-like flavin-dependent oxidoreductase (luciferase family)